MASLTVALSLGCELLSHTHESVKGLTSDNALSVARAVGMQVVNGFIHACHQLQGQLRLPILMPEKKSKS